jgi:precorrin-6x reductase
VEELTEQVVDATHPFSETLGGGSLQGQRVTSVEMALYLGPQKVTVFSQLFVLL